MVFEAAFKTLARAFAAGPMFLAACASEPKIDAARLAGRSNIRIDARIAEQASVNAGAIPRGQKAGVDAAGGAAVGAVVWFQHPVTAAIAISAPVVILASGAAGAAVGGAYGAATGSSASQEEIDASVRVLSASFRPALYERTFEENLSKAFADRLKAVSEACVEGRRERGKCRPGPARGDLNFKAMFQLAPPPTGGTTGAIDIVGVVTVWADPRGLVEPNCISWRYRARAGDLIDLASNAGASLKARMSQVVPQMAGDLALLLLPAGGAMPAPQPNLQGKGLRQSV